MITKNKFEFISHSTHHHRHPFWLVGWFFFHNILTALVDVDLFEYIDRVLGNGERQRKKSPERLSDMQNFGA